MSELYLHGRSLISVLGGDLSQAISTLAQGGVEPERIALPGGTVWPCYTIAQSELPWRERILALIAEALEQAACGGLHDAPLFIASSSFNIGAIETGQASLDEDYLTFAESIATGIGWRGEVYLVSTACTSSLHALLAAAAHLHSGAPTDAVVLGIELANHYTLAGFASMQLLSPNAARPLGATRDGLVLGEAVAALHLSRNPARWRLRGGSTLVDGRDPTGARAESVGQLCREALAASGLAPQEIDLIKVQAAGSPLNDSHEISGLREVFGSVPPLVSLKGVIGHTLGASGVAELALLLTCLEQQIWPHTDYPFDAEIACELASESPSRMRNLLAVILGFGGGYAAVAVEDCHG